MYSELSKCFCQNVPLNNCVAWLYIEYVKIYIYGHIYTYIYIYIYGLNIKLDPKPHSIHPYYIFYEKYDTGVGFGSNMIFRDEEVYNG